MSTIRVKLENGILSIHCERSRETERDYQEIDITELRLNKRYTSYVKAHNNVNQTIILYYEPMKITFHPSGMEDDGMEADTGAETAELMQESGMMEEKPLPVLFVIQRGTKLLYGYMEADRIYKLLIDMRYKLTSISISPRYLKVKLFAYLINTSDEQIERVRFVIDEKNQVEAPLKIEKSRIGRLKLLLGHHYYQFKLPIQNLLSDETQVNNMLNIVVTVNGVDLEFRIGKKERKLTNTRKYYATYAGCYRDEFALHLRRTNRGNFAVVKRLKEPIEDTMRFRIMESKPVSWFLYHWGRFVAKHSSTKVILFYEKFAEKAEEGTFDLFEIARKKKTSRCYYIIDQKSSDYARIKDVPGVVKKYSLKYYWLIYRVNNYVSTEAPAHLNILRSNNKYFRLTTCEHPFIFLQHGVTYLKCQGAGSTFAVGKEGEPAYMIVGSKKERDVCSDMLRLSEERLLNTGLPIFSKIEYNHMNQQTEDKVVIMLTWKSYEEHIQQFENSEYYQNVMAIYHMLTKFIDPSGIIIVPHPKMAELVENTSLKDTMWNRPISEVLSVAKLLITDYSSVCYNSFYQGGGVVFYQPDLELYESQVGALIPRDDEYIGPRTFDIEQLEQVISRIIVDGEILLDQVRNKEYEKRYATINEFTDGKNIERIADQLQELGII